MGRGPVAGRRVSSHFVGEAGTEINIPHGGAKWDGKSVRQK